MRPDGTLEVVVVDDHPLFRSGITPLLEEWGIAVVGEAATGEDGVELVADRRPDVVLMDVSMPGISGVEAARRIRSFTPSVRVIMLTISTEDALVIEAVLAGASGYLLKDATVDQLAEAVRSAAAGEAVLAPRVAARVLEHLRGADCAPAVALERPQLSARERQVLGLLVDGRDNAEIAETLYISHSTVKSHVSSILDKLHVENRVQAAVRAVRSWIA
jgi:two-component system, NarL family, response regulator LiaR